MFKDKQPPNSVYNFSDSWPIIEINHSEAENKQSAMKPISVKETDPEIQDLAQYLSEFF